MPALTILTPDEEESLADFAKRIAKTKGEVLAILSWREKELSNDDKKLKKFLDVCKGISARLRIATKNDHIAMAARTRGIRVIESVSDLKKLLKGNPQLEESLRAFSPQVWKQQLRSRLQQMGLLSLPKLRIYILIFVSAALFIFVFFKLLPSAEIKIVPREDTISQTANIFLVLSGSTVDIPDRVRTMELWPVKADITKTITYDQISKQFIGESARADITIVNNAEEVYSLRSGSRLVNQAGMIFRMLDAINIEPGEQIVVRAKADDLDLYGEIIGERGNVPAELKWDFAGLSYTEQDLVYGINEEPGRGGTTAYREVLAEEDLQAAKTQLMSELHNEAKQLVDEKRDVFNAEHENQTMEMLYYEELTTVEYDEIDLPRQFIGIPTQTIPVEGTIHYTAFAYDSQYVLELLAEELKTHVGEGRRLLNETVNLNRLIAHVIDYSDDLSWIKLTVDLSGTEQYVLDPLSPWGARFAKSVRDLVTDLGTKEAKRIIKNLPEVEEASIHLWPPWNRTLPAIPSQIKITPVLDS